MALFLIQGDPPEANHLYGLDAYIYVDMSTLSETDIKKTFVWKRLDYMLKYNTHSKFNSQHDWEDTYSRHLMNMKYFTSIMNMTFTRAPEITRKVATTPI